MLGAAIVPEGDGVRPPAKAALEERIFHVLVEIAQHALALIDGNAGDPGGEAAIDVERLLSGDRMGAHHRMFGLRIAWPVLLAGEIEQSAIDMLAVVDCLQTGEISLHAIR